MYAVIKAGGKQQRVKAGDVIEVELMHGHDEVVTFTPLLVVDDEGKTHVGRELGKAVVKAKLVGEKKGDKVKVFKYRPKSGYARHQGHRQMYTLVEIQDVSLGARRAAAKKPAEADQAATMPDAGAESKASKAGAESKASKPGAETKASEDAAEQPAGP